MKKYKSIDFDILALKTIFLFLLTANILLFIFPHKCVVSPHSLIATSRTNAKAIQSALAQYYSDYNSYPDEKKLSKSLRPYFTKLPSYKNSRKMIKIYKRISKECYEIEFNNDTQTDEDESKSILTPDVDTNKLFH